MKSLTQFIKESLEKPTYFRLSLNAIEGGKEVGESIEAMGVQHGFYVERVDDGVKVKFDQNNIKEASRVIEIVQTFISGIPSEDHEKIGEPLAKLVAQVENLSEKLDDSENEEKPAEEPKKEEPKKEENKNKEEE